MARKNTQQPVPPPAFPLTVAEAAAIARVCRRTIHRWVLEGRFRSVRPVAAGSGKRLIDRDDFLAFVGMTMEGAA